MFKAAAAVQTMFLLNHAGGSFHDGALRAKGNTFPAADAGIRDLVPFGGDVCVSSGIALPENGIDPQIEILDRHIPDTEHDADTAGASGIYILKIRLFLENQIPPLLLFLSRNRRRCSGQPDHFLVQRVAQDLNLSGG